jgi:hypothetical protein
VKRAAIAAVVWICATGTARADTKVVTIVGDGKDVAKTLLVGPSGQLYEPDGKGAWARHAEGGVAADVTGAARIDGDVVVAGRAAPLYRAHRGTWSTLRIGADGTTVMSTGPAAAVAVKKAVFVATTVKGKTGWTRVGSLSGKKVTGLWASGPKSVWASTDSGVYQLRGGRFAKVNGAGAPGGISGGTPWAVTDKGLVDLDGKTTCPAELDGAAVTIAGAGGAPGADELTVVVDTGTGLVLARTAKNGKSLERIDAVPGTGAVAGVAVDGDGDVLVAFQDGSFAMRQGGTWTQGQVADDLPKPRAGSAPARTR